MFLDRDLMRSWSDRVAREAGVDLIVSVWRGTPPAARAERLAGNGDLLRAGACGGAGWTDLEQGKVVEALNHARKAQANGQPILTLLEAEALIAAGAIVAGMRTLERLSASGNVPATVALARRRHTLGDHRGAVQAAARLPMHAQATLAAGRALMSLHNAPEALRRIDPFLTGGAPIPDAMTAGAFAALGASALARSGQGEALHRLAQRLLACTDTPSDAAPSLARVAWTGGLAREAWDRFNDDKDPWMAVGRLELAALAGNAALMRGLAERAGPLAAPTMAALPLIEGTVTANTQLEADKTCHVWRTHPTRWQPWIDAAAETGARLEMCDLATGKLPAEEEIPAAAMDDGALAMMVQPRPVPPRKAAGKGVWIDTALCAGIGVGHDWPPSEQKVLESLVPVVQPADAAVWITGADRALAHANEGRPTVVLAPPGDPFWAGPLPERAWPAMRIVRAHAHQGWTGAGERVAEAANELAAGGG